MFLYRARKPPLDTHTGQIWPMSRDLFRGSRHFRRDVRVVDLTFGNIGFCTHGLCTRVARVTGPGVVGQPRVSHAVHKTPVSMSEPSGFRTVVCVDDGSVSGNRPAKGTPANVISVYRKFQIRFHTHTHKWHTKRERRGFCSRFFPLTTSPELLTSLPVTLYSRTRTRHRPFFPSIAHPVSLSSIAFHRFRQLGLVSVLSPPPVRVARDPWRPAFFDWTS